MGDDAGGRHGGREVNTSAVASVKSSLPRPQLLARPQVTWFCDSGY